MNPSDRSYALTLKPADVAARLKLRRAVVVRMMETGRLRAENTSDSRNAYWRTSEAWLAEYQRGQTVGNNGRETPAAPDKAGASPVIGLEYLAHG